MRSDTLIRFVLWIVALFLVKVLLGLFYVFTLPPVSVDDYFRIFHALWWWDHMSFTSSYTWLPGHQYLYGTIVGSCNDTIIAPRIATLIFQSATGGAFLFATEVSRRARLVGLGWILFSPLSLLLGTTPLTESLAYLWVTIHWVLVLRAADSQNAWVLFLSALALLFACAIRYELWLLTIPYIVWFRNRNMKSVSPLVKWAILMMPLIFPTVWILHGTANPEGTFAFLRATKEDHLGQGSFWKIIMTPTGAISFVQFVFLAVLVMYRRALRSSLAGLYFLALASVVIGLVAMDSLPSQLTSRVFYGPVLLGGFFVGNSILKNDDSLVPLNRIVLICGVIILFGFGAVAVASTPLGIKKENQELSKWLQKQYLDRAQNDGDHVVVAHYLPDSAAILVLSNNVERVHIDAMEKGCVIQLLSEYKPVCELSAWAADTQIAVVRKSSAEQTYVESLQWRHERSFGRWLVYRRPADSVFPVLNKPLHPVLRNIND